IRRAVKKTRQFKTQQEGYQYLDSLYTLPLDGPEFAARAGMGSDSGYFSVVTTLSECPEGKAQVWQEEGWATIKGRKYGPVTRYKSVPQGLDLAPLLRGKAAAAKA